MMRKQVRMAVPSSVVLVMDQSVGDIPQSMNGSVVSTSSTCVAVGTASETDGQVLLELTDTPPELDAELSCILASRILTPNGEVAVCSVYNEKLLSIDVPLDISHIEVWVNHPSEPDRIVVVAR